MLSITIPTSPEKPKSATNRLISSTAQKCILKASLSTSRKIYFFRAFELCFGRTLRLRATAYTYLKLPQKTKKCAVPFYLVFDCIWNTLMSRYVVNLTRDGTFLIFENSHILTPLSLVFCAQIMSKILCKGFNWISFPRDITVSYNMIFGTFSNSENHEF